MISAEEISELKTERLSLEKRLEKIGKGQRPAVIRLTERLKALVEDIESTLEKEKTEWNPAISTRIKIAKKGARLFKGLNYFECEVAGEFQRGGIPEDTAKGLISASRLIKENKMAAAKEELRRFGEIAELCKRCEMAEEEMKEKGQALGREQLKIKSLLAEMSELEKETVDAEKVRRHGELLENLEKLEKARGAYLDSLLSEPVAELLGDIERQSIRDYYPGFPEKVETAALSGFFSDYPEFGKCNVGQLCEFFGYSEKKLSHACPETSRFRKVVLGNRKFFETLHALGQTAFLAVDGGDEAVLDFYAARIEGAQKAVERVRALREGKSACREEYEKSGRIGKRREELSKYSKEGLEKELKSVESLIELLHSEQKGATSAGQPGKPGFFSKILSALSGP